MDNEKLSMVQVVEVEKIKIKGGKVYSFFKRAFDIFASLFGIIILSPVLLIVGILVKCTSKGPMIYVSTRVGLNGKEFKFYKFRSMVDKADEMKDQLLDQNEVEGGITFKMEDDPRITKFGKFIRKTSLDELPQLFNILKGDMSIVGPRCPLPEEVEMYNEYQKQRLLVPQGLTGEWQVTGRCRDCSFEEMIEQDLAYISKKRGFFYDIGIIFRTVWVVLTGKGAK